MTAAATTGPASGPLARLIATCHWPDAALQRRAFAAECRMDVVFPERQTGRRCGGPNRPSICCTFHDAMVRGTGREVNRRGVGSGRLM